MEDYNDPNNIIGITDLLVDDGEDINIDEIEKSLLNDIPDLTTKEDETDIVQEFNNELSNLSKQFESNTFDINTTDNTSTNINTGINSNLSNEIDELLNTVVNKPSAESTVVDIPWTPDKPHDYQLSRMTNEERKQEHVNKVLNSMHDSDDDFIDEDEQEEEMAMILERIDLLKGNLEIDGVDISRIQEVDANTSMKDAKRVLRILQIKNDRLRYCDMFEELILSCAYGLESIFDGKKEWFGKKIDLIGYSDTVKVKLRRMRYDTSSFISGVVQDYSLGHGWRIIFELLPSLFLYSRDRRLKNNDNLISDANYREAMRDLTDV